MCPLNLEPIPNTEIKRRFSIRGWEWIGLIGDIEVVHGSYSAVSQALREIKENKRSAADIPRVQEPPPKRSKRYIFWNASKAV